MKPVLTKSVLTKSVLRKSVLRKSVLTKPVLMMVALGLVFVVGAGASAQDSGSVSSTPRTHDEREAQMRFELGRRYYDTGRFLEAAREFRAAIDIAPLPALYFNLYVAYRDAGEDERAMATLRIYIDTLESGDRRTQLQARLATMEARAALPDDPGDPVLVGVQMDVESGTSRSADPEVAPWILVGSGVLLGVGAVVTGVLSMRERSALDERCATRDTCSAGFEDTQSLGQTLSITTDVLWITGAAAVTAGIVWAIVGMASDEAPLTTGLACDEHGCLASLRGQF